ncbi:hypothetical protein O3M35_001388 [Rhynocoris fuscipes]|uniref:Generative cell specific-1/HAP2 domain-containing protein n=1 Tax=Rhynocoris fuscipes TaxID=488301 RepID=A0AAW1CMB4_9HEMI
MLVKELFLIFPTIILSETIINSQSKDYCPGNADTHGRMPRLQIRSVLVRCPNKGEFQVVKNRFDENTNLSMIRTQDLLEFFGYDTDEPLLHSEVTKCRRKLVVTIQLANCGQTKTDEEFVLIDQVYDPVWKQRIRLLNPMVFRIKQYQVEQAYGLNIQHIVNAEAREEVFNKNNKSYKGCYTSGLNPTCGYSFYHDEVIPYSEGFCCSCDPYLNLQRQPDNIGRPPLSPIAFTSREGNIPQGFPVNPKLVKKGKKTSKCKARSKRSLQDTMDEIYSDFATKIKSFMVPEQDRGNDDQYWMANQERHRRAVLRLSPKYYNLPPLQPAKGFGKYQDVPDSNPWELQYRPPTCNKSHKGDTQVGTECYQSQKQNSVIHTLNKVRRLKEDRISFMKMLPQMVNGEHLDAEETDGYNFRPEHYIDMLKYMNQTSWLRNQMNPYKDYKITDASESRSKDKHKDIARNIKTINQNKENLKNSRRKKHKRSKRQITSSGIQIRGGQSCVDRHTPTGVDHEAYHESAHCLRFSELWYNVYRLKTPFIVHRTEFRLFEKHATETGTTHWHDLTKKIKHSALLGTFVRHLSDNDHDPSLVFTYTPLSDLQKGQFCLDPVVATLLVPRPVPKHLEHKFPQIKSGPKEYLLVRSEDVSFDGEDCDRAGTSFRAFAKQPLRCAHVKGTCLANQPLHLWQHDIELKKKGKPGKYFLENYARLSNQPIQTHKEVGDYLTLDFTGPYQSVVEVEVPIDKNALVRADSTAQISEIYIDSTCEYQTRITVLVTNTGLTSYAFYPRMQGCPPEIPHVWTENEGPLVYIAPQKVHRYRLSLYGKLPVTRFHCSIEIFNKKKELVATRRIRVQNFDRCICMWHCLCACSGSVQGIRCAHMSLEHYHAAGFGGALPVDTEGPGAERSELCVSELSLFSQDDYIKYMIGVYAVLLVLGSLKCLLGLVFPGISNYGMWLLFECRARSLKRYRESIWLLTELVKDNDGYPVSPASRSRNLQILSKCSQSLANIFFFCALPGVLLLKLHRGCCSLICFTISFSKWHIMNSSLCEDFCKRGCGRYIARFIRRLQRIWRRNCMVPIMCIMNPFFLYSLCKANYYTQGGEQGEGLRRQGLRREGFRREGLRRQGPETLDDGGCGGSDDDFSDEREPSTTTMRFVNYFTLPQFRFQNESKVRPDAKKLAPIIEKGEDLDVVNASDSIIVKRSDYPNLDRKVIMFVVKYVSKGFHEIMNEVLKTYRVRKQEKDINSVLNEAELVKNQKMKQLVCQITKAAIIACIRIKQNFQNQGTEAIDRIQVKIQAEQITILIDRILKELIKKKIAFIRMNEQRVKRRKSNQTLQRHKGKDLLVKPKMPGNSKFVAHSLNRKSGALSPY